MFLGSFELSTGLVLIPRLMSMGFVVCFGIPIIRGRTVKGPRGVMFYVDPRFGLFCVLLL